MNARGPDQPEGTAGPRGQSHLARYVAAEIERLTSEPLAPGLILVATPIGNLGDITLRALAALARADVVCCEDTRHSLKLLERYGLARPLRAYHDHNAERERPRILDDLAAGKSVVLISDAGTPSISDPGYKLVVEAAAAGHSITGIPGPSAVIAALAIAGLPTDTFTFAGFLPSKPMARRERLRVLSTAPGTLVVFEAPGRLAETLSDMAAELGDRPAAIARELTKLHEEVERGSLARLSAEAADREARGEHVILVAPGEKRPASEPEIIAALQEAMARMSLRDAVRDVSDHLQSSRKRVYDLAIRLQSDRSRP